MNKQQFLGMSLGSGLKIARFDMMSFFTLNGIIEDEYSIAEYPYVKGRNGNIKECRIVLRPLPDLTKPITQANYNCGKPFVPIEELYNSDGFEEVGELSNLASYIKNYGLNFVPFLIVELLIHWHFNLMDESEPFIDINSLELNPYA